MNVGVDSYLSIDCSRILEEKLKRLVSDLVSRLVHDVLLRQIAIPQRIVHQNARVEDFVISYVGNFP